MLPREEMVIHMLPKGQKWPLFEGRGKLGQRHPQSNPAAWSKGGSREITTAVRPCFTQGPPWPCRGFLGSLAGLQPSCSQLWEPGTEWENAQRPSATYHQCQVATPHEETSLKLSLYSLSLDQWCQVPNFRTCGYLTLFLQFRDDRCLGAPPITHWHSQDNGLVS